MRAIVHTYCIHHQMTTVHCMKSNVHQIAAVAELIVRVRLLVSEKQFLNIPLLFCFHKLTILGNSCNTFLLYAGYLYEQIILFYLTKIVVFFTSNLFSMHFAAKALRRHNSQIRSRMLLRVSLQMFKIKRCLKLILVVDCQVLIY